jgi:sialate O-acetylesterase
MDNGGIQPFQDKLNLGIPGIDPGPTGATWSYCVETAGPALTAQARAAYPIQPKGSTPATYLYNGMVNPLIPYAIRGAIWYQGETQHRGYQYRTLLPALIADWRSHWGEGNFPFYIVQLANYWPVQPQPSASGWAELREAQSLAAANVPNTGLAVAIDLGETANVHAKNKQDVGYRLALTALAGTYGWKVEYSGPLYESMTVEGSAIRLKFSHTGGMAARGGPLSQFAIAGEDQKFVWADAKIDGTTVIVSSPQVPKPVAVRYAWANNPLGANLYNGAGLPASPFRTDNWPETSVNDKE